MVMEFKIDYIIMSLKVDFITSFSSNQLVSFAIDVNCKIIFGLVSNLHVEDHDLVLGYILKIFFNCLCSRPSTLYLNQTSIHTLGNKSNQSINKTNQLVSKKGGKKLFTSFSMEKIER